MRDWRFATRVMTGKPFTSQGRAAPSQRASCRPRSRPCQLSGLTGVGDAKKAFLQSPLPEKWDEPGVASEEPLGVMWELKKSSAGPEGLGTDAGQPRDTDAGGEARSETEQNRRVFVLRSRPADDKAHGWLHRGGITARVQRFFHALRQTLMVTRIQHLTEPGQMVELLEKIIERARRGSTVACNPVSSDAITTPEGFTKGRQDAKTHLRHRSMSNIVFTMLLTTLITTHGV